MLSVEAAWAQLVIPAAPPDQRTDAAARPAPERGFEVLFAEPGITLPRGWTVDFAGSPCATCPTRWSAGVVNGNAPWQMSGTVTWQGDRDTAALGLTARRGARLPLHMAPGSNPAHAPSASEALLSDSRTELVLTLRGEHVLWRSRGGRTASMFGELFLPVGTTGLAGERTGTRDVKRGSNLALINGVRVRF